MLFELIRANTSSVLWFSSLDFFGMLRIHGKCSKWPQTDWSIIRRILFQDDPLKFDAQSCRIVIFTHTFNVFIVCWCTYASLKLDFESIQIRRGYYNDLIIFLWCTCEAGFRGQLFKSSDAYSAYIVFLYTTEAEFRYKIQKHINYMSFVDCFMDSRGWISIWNLKR